MPQNQYEGNKILLVEDEETLAFGLEYNLKDEGYFVDWAPDGRKALDYISQNEYDLIVLDIMLPYYDGFEITRKVRETSPQLPILILTARTSPDDKVKGLELGADDYMTKPFHLQEFLIRIKGMLKRKLWYKNSIITQAIVNIGDCKIDFEKFTCVKDGEIVTLTYHQAMVLKYLIENKGRVVTRKELLENVWHINPDVETRTIDIFISHLRKYIEPDPNKPVYIKSVRGAGYIFDDSK